MKLKKTAVLTSRQKKQVENLISLCRQYEPIRLTPNLTSEQNFNPSLPCFFLLTDGDMLVSFLALFLPRQDYGEAIGFTHPAARKRGYFTKLWDAALDVLDEAGVLEDMELLLVTDGNSPEASKALAAMDGEYQYSEFFLKKALQPLPSPETVPYDLKPVFFSEEDLTCLSGLHEEIFCDGQRASTDFIKEMLNDPDTKTYLLSKDAEPFGLFHLSMQSTGCYLSGFGIHPDWQGKGLGHLLLRLAESKASEFSDSLFLQIGSSNEAALSLYQKHDYEEMYHLEYYF